MDGLLDLHYREIFIQTNFSLFFSLFRAGDLQSITVGIGTARNCGRDFK